ncbi:potassium channel family protein [Methanobrevibacter sp.]
MYVIIMGGGRVGLSLASLLIDDGYDITLLENNEVLASNASSELDALVIGGSGTETKILEEANIQDADFFVATTGNDETNLLSCILVREYGIPKIIARVSNPDHEEAFRKVGVDEVINPERTAAGYLEKIITRPNVADLTAFGQGDAEILDMIVTNNKVIGKQIYEVSPDDDYIIIATYEDGKLEIPKQDDLLTKGEKISILVKRDAIKRTEKKFE